MSAHRRTKQAARGPFSRRTFMKAAAAAGALSVAPRTSAREDENTWKNWSGAVVCHPRYIERPESEAEVIELLRKAQRENLVVRLVGSGHSFTPVCATDDMLISLARMSGVTGIDSATRQARILGGTKIQQMHLPLRQAGIAMNVISDIDRQAIAGALATGTHGTGKTIQSIPNQVVSMRIVTASGDVVECSAEKNPELFNAARVSIGALGIVTEVTMQMVPAYRLHARNWRIKFDRCTEQLDELFADNRHFEFFWAQRTDDCYAKALNATRKAPDPLPDLKEEQIDHSDIVFPSVRSMRMNETEWSLPAENGLDCLREVRQLLFDKYPGVAMPLEYRAVARDDILLSMAQGRETVTLSAHRSARYDFKAYFLDVEAICRNHNGRPHWGKIHTLGAQELSELYPMWDQFHAVRRELDPSGRFMNPHLKAIFED